MVIVGDLIEERLEHARSSGCETIDISKGDPKDQIEQILGVPEVDAAVDAVGWSFTTGQCPVMRYHHGLMQMMLDDRAQITKAVNATVITLDQAPQGYKDFDHGAARKYVFNPHGVIKAKRSVTARPRRGLAAARRPCAAQASSGGSRSTS